MSICPIHKQEELWHPKGYYICPVCFENRKASIEREKVRIATEKARCASLPVEALIKFGEEQLSQPVHGTFITSEELLAESVRKAPKYAPKFVYNGFYCDPL